MVSIDNLQNSDNSVFKNYFANNGVVNGWINAGKLFHVISKGVESQNSFCLQCPQASKAQIPGILMERFGIKDENLFRTKYEEAVAGDGQEWRRITRLHSSSLIALLCFYNISANHKLTWNGYTFEESYFEVKTKVGGGFSNMDVVLRGTDKDGKKVVLFLESKFSEYLDGGKCDDISHGTYFKYYNQLDLFKNPISNITFRENGQKIWIEPKNSRKEPVYCGGIKQMLSHYIGVSGYKVEREDALAKNKKAHKRFKADSDEKVMLGEILFDFGDAVPDATERMRNYKCAYSQLAKIINEKGEIEMLEHVLTYQELFMSNTIEDKIVKSFYGL